MNETPIPPALAPALSSPAAPPPHKKNYFQSYALFVTIATLVAIPLGLLLGAAVTYVMPRMYVSTGIIQVRPNINLESNQEQQSPNISQNFFGTQFKILTTDSILTPVMNQLHLKESWGFTEPQVLAQLRSSITAQNIRGTDLIEVIVTLRDAQDARDIAKAIIVSFENYHEKTPPQSQDSSTNQSLSVEIHQQPALAEKPSSPNVTLNLVIGSVAFPCLIFLISIFITVIRYLSRK